MRGQQERTGSLFSYVSIEDRIPASHPLRRIRKLADQALDRLNPTFCKLYAAEGRPSVPPEQLLLASLLQAFYGIRSERLLLEQLHYNLLFRWFVGLSPDDPSWPPTMFTKNRERLLNDEVMGRFLEKWVCMIEPPIQFWAILVNAARGHTTPEAVSRHMAEVQCSYINPFAWKWAATAASI